ncbi:MAG: type II toxin-antitoxin system RelE/ParE family toxin [Cyanobacteriota bacterium]|nr:type II toxin-antitoxin system RelE/ParE family toxin [Cyanobacteriota bacterium]
MIQCFSCSETEKLFKRSRTRKFPSEIQRRGLKKLTMLHAAVKLQDLRSPPGNRLELLEGDRAGQHSIRVNKAWRVCFRWEDGDAYDVEINLHYQ